MLQAKTQDIIPESGLGPQNSQWRRWVERSITDLKLGFTAFKADIANSFKAVSSSMDLLSRQVATTIVPAVGSDYSYTGTLTETFATLVSFTIPVPAGYTRAVVYSSYTMNGSTDLDGYNVFFTQILINGVAGPPGVAVPLSTGGDLVYSSATAFYSKIITGISGSSTITVAGQARVDTSVGSDNDVYSSVSAQVLFLR